MIERRALASRLDWLLEGLTGVAWLHAGAFEAQGGPAPGLCSNRPDNSWLAMIGLVRVPRAFPLKTL